MSKVEKTPQLLANTDDSESSAQQQREGRRLLPDMVLKMEREYIIKRRKEVNPNNNNELQTDDKKSGNESKTDKTEDEVDITADSLWKEEDAPLGLALSGGGIRSATFNLGVIQALAKKGILKKCDYLSTVSGGGYIGGCLTSLLSGPGLGETNQKDSDQEQQSNPHGTNADNLPLHDPDQIHHLRKHGNYLVTRKGAFRKEALRAIGLVVTGISSTLLIYLLTMMAAAVGFILLTGTAASSNLWCKIHNHGFCDWKGALRELWTEDVLAFPILIYFSLGVLINTLAAWASYRFYWNKLDKLDEALSTSPQNAGETNNDRSARNALWLYGGSIFVLVNIALFLPLLFHADNNILVYAVIAFFGVFSSSWVAYVCQPDQFRAKYTNPHYRSYMGAVLGIGLYAVVLSTVFIFIIALIQYFRDQTWADWAAALTAIGGFIYARLTVKQASSGGPNDGKLKKILRLLFILIVPISILLTFVVCVSLSLHLVFGILDAKSPQVITPWPQGFLLLGLLLLLAIALIFCFINLNHVSPHYFYRDRLAETYFQTNLSTGFGLVPYRNDSEHPLKDLHDTENGSPYHLVQCAVNMPGSRDLARKDRNSDHFTFSKYFCGSTSTGYAPTFNYRDGKTTLLHAITISGAAASSMMGKLSSCASSFILTVFNIRLGYWLPNPINTIGIQRSPLVEGRYHNSDKFITPEVPEKGADLEENPAGFKWLHLLWLELMGSATAKKKYINLSDGGHTGDNLAIYPLLQRRCKTIICCDAEADPNYDFTSLISVINQIFVDENISIKIDINEIRPESEDNLAIKSIIYGDIHYPTETGYLGRIVYIKSSFTDTDEPPPVKGYAARNPKFPQQSTGDQFFDDDQFEAYRALGAHIATKIDKDELIYKEKE